MGTYAVTGSASGIGAAVARRISDEGHRVIGVDLHDAHVVGDLATTEGREAAVAGVTDAAGGTLDGLVACAGIGGSTGAPSGLVARINYFGAVTTLEGLRPSLSVGERPAAVVISSNSATMLPLEGDDDGSTLVDLLLAGDEAAACAFADTLDGELVYMRAKLALTRRLRRWAPEWAAAGIRLNAVAPGPVLTELTRRALEHPLTGPAIRELPVPMDRWGEPEEIAAAVWFLLHGGGSFVHGSVLFVDGGTDALIRPDSF